jgi:hypothetical protein
MRFMVGIVWYPNLLKLKILASRTHRRSFTYVYNSIEKGGFPFPLGEL